MLNSLKIVCVAASLAVVSGCGMSSAPAPDVAAYQKVIADTRTTVADHRQAGPTITTSTCVAQRDHYLSTVQPQLDHMRQMSGGMDDHLMEMGGSGGMSSMCGQMDDEVAHHAAIACTGSDATIQAEVTRHCDAMDQLLAGLSDRAGAMDRMMSTSMMSWGACGR